MSIQHVIITHQYSLNAPGGGTRSCLKIIQQMRQLGIKVTAIQVSYNPYARPNTDNAIDAVITVEPHPWHYLLTGLKVAKAVEKVIDQQPVDAVLSWNYEAAFLPQLLRKKNIVFGMIAAMPSYERWANRPTRFKPLKRLTDEWFRWRPFKQADVIYVSSKFTQQELIRLFAIAPQNIEVTGRGIDRIFHQSKLSASPKVSNFIFYGWLEPIKGVFDAIEALGIVAQQGYTDWTFYIAGWGNTSAVIEAAQQAGIDDRIQLLGRLAPKALARELARSDLAILPSRAESFGRSIAEAQAASLAVVSYRIGSIPEVIEAGITGWLAPARHPKNLAAAIIEAIENPTRTFELGQAGHERATHLFTWEKTTRAIVDGIAVRQQSLAQKPKRQKNQAKINNV